MSTYYYPFKAGITSVRLTEGPGHDRVEVWQRHAKCGDLVVDLGTGREIVALFCAERALAQTVYGGESLGLVVNWLAGSAELRDTDYLWGGELVTKAELSARAGKGRKSDKPDAERVRF